MTAREMTPAEKLSFALERLVHNVAIERGISRERAIFLIECGLAEMKRRNPPPPTPPAAELETRAAA